MKLNRAPGTYNVPVRFAGGNHSLGRRRVTLSTRPYFLTTRGSWNTGRTFESLQPNNAETRPWPAAAQDKHRNTDPSLFLVARQPLSLWSRSRAKRIFDCACVLLMMPLFLPVLFTVALAVRLTSAGPVLFLQKRVGCRGREFTILKFRTMMHVSNQSHMPVTTSGNQNFTLVGPFLRRWKLDELPQLFNVLAGQMSLVGPRPKLPQHAVGHIPCRAGITGAATVAFAREEALLDRVPQNHLHSFYHSAILPAKHRIDAEYMANATFLSDFKLIFNSVFRRWDNSVMERLLTDWAFELRTRSSVAASATESEPASRHSSMLPAMGRPAPAGEARAV